MGRNKKVIHMTYVKGEEVTELITNGMEEIFPEKQERELQSFQFERRPIETKPHIEYMSWRDLFILALASGGTMAAIIVAIMSIPDLPFWQVAFAAIAALDLRLMMKHLGTER